MQKYLLITIILLSNIAFSQTYSTKSRKAIKLYERAKNLYRMGNINEALTNLDKATNTDKKFVEAYWLKADIYHNLDKPTTELENYKKAIEAGPNFSSRLYYELAEAYMRN
jgi:Tfp pilus assembly protein PilF